MSRNGRFVPDALGAWQHRLVTSLSGGAVGQRRSTEGMGGGGWKIYNLQLPTARIEGGLSRIGAWV